MSKIEFRSASNFQFLISLLWRAGCLAGIFYLLLHYEENPPVIIVATVLVSIAFFIIGNDEITVYTDRVVWTDTSIINYIFPSHAKVYYIKDIQSASLPNDEGPDIFDRAIIEIIVRFLPKKPSRDNDNPFYLDMKNGDAVTISTAIDMDDVKRIVIEINSLVK